MKTKITISKKLKLDYFITVRKDAIVIGSPAYVEIKRDEGFEIVNTDTVIRFYNSKAVVSLWKQIKLEHITIY